MYINVHVHVLNRPQMDMSCYKSISSGYYGDIAQNGGLCNTVLLQYAMDQRRYDRIVCA